MQILTRRIFYCKEKNEYYEIKNQHSLPESFARTGDAIFKQKSNSQRKPINTLKTIHDYNVFLTIINANTSIFALSIMYMKFLLFVVFSFLLSTATAFACETKSNKCCCKKENTSDSKKDCCKKVTKNNNENKSCNGKCGHFGCNLPVVQIVVIVPFITEINCPPFYKSIKKAKFYDFKTPVSSGFKSIWLPPVIG